MLFVLSLFLVSSSSDASLRQTRGARPARKKFVRLSYTIHRDDDDDDDEYYLTSGRHVDFFILVHG